MSRSSSGTSLRHDLSIPHPEHLQNSSYIQRSSRANSDVIRRSNSPSNHSHNRQSSGGGFNRFSISKYRQSGNSNRNNSTRISPNLQRSVLDSSETMPPGQGNKSSPMMGQRHLGTVAVDQHAASMLHRVAASRSGDERQHPRIQEERSLASGSSHYGSMSSLNPPGPPYAHHVSHQRSRAGRSLDEGDPTSLSSNTYAMLSSASSGVPGRTSPSRRPSGLEKASTSRNGHNSPHMGMSSLEQAQRYGSQSASQMQRLHPTRMSGTSFSSSFH